MTEKDEFEYTSLHFGAGDKTDRIASQCYDAIRKLLRERNLSMVEALHHLLQTVSATKGVLKENDMDIMFFNHLGAKFKISPQTGTPFVESLYLANSYNDEMRRIVQENIPD